MDKTKIQKLRSEGLTYQEIGDKFNLTRQRVSQILTDYYQRPEVKAYHKAYQQRPEAKEYRKKYYREYNKKLQNLLCEICSLVESGTLTVGAFGISQNSVDFARKYLKK